MSDHNRHRPALDPLLAAKKELLQYFSPKLIVDSLLLLGQIHNRIHKSYDETGTLTHFMFNIGASEQSPPCNFLYIHSKDPHTMIVYECELFSYTPDPETYPSGEPMPDRTTMLIYRIANSTKIRVY